MRSRRLLVFGSLCIVSALAGWYLVAARQHPSRWSLSAPLVRSQWAIRPPVVASAALSSSADLAEKLEASLLYASRLITSDKQLVIYAAAGLFGLLMMALAIKNSAPTDLRKPDGLVELLKEQKEKAENLARLKSEFLNQVSHELRTPLAVIIGYIECLTDGLYGQVDNRHHDILQIVAKQSGHLKNMIDQILIYSRLEASKQSLRIEEFEPVKILVDLRETFDFLCVQKGLQLKWDFPRSTVVMKSDPEKFKEIASNLLQNAVKYTDQGLIIVHVDDSKASDTVVLKISDTGVGIPVNALGNVFEPFVQVHKTSTENSRGGIGLGLSIVKKHVEQMNGTINVESELGKGSKFTITLPRLYRNAGKRNYTFFKIKLPFPRLYLGYALVRRSLQHRGQNGMTRESGGI